MVQRLGLEPMHLFLLQAKAVFFVPYEEGLHRNLPTPSFGYGSVWFWLGCCFSVAAGMERISFLLAELCRGWDG